MRYECHVDIIRMLKLGLSISLPCMEEIEIKYHITQKVEIGIMWHGNNVCGSF